MGKIKKKTRLLEDDIKASLLQHLRKKGSICKKSIIVSEFNIDDFSRRVDLLVTSHTDLCAYEIKSEADSLYRLEDQIEKYQQFFDKVIVVAAPKHIANIIKLVTSDIAIWEVSNSGFKIVQRGRKQRNQDGLSLLKLMGVNDLRSLAVKMNCAPKVMRRSSLEKALLNFSQEKIRVAAINSIRKKYSRSSAHFWRLVKGKIKSDHIAELSPFFIERKRVEEIKAEQKIFWERWSQEARQLLDDPLLLKLCKESDTNVFGQVPSHIQDMLTVH